jgi:hypothetical protein
MLPTEGIQAIVDRINQIIILICLESGGIQMFFPKLINPFFIKKDDLESYTFREVLESRQINVESFKKDFNGENINFDLTIIDFLQVLFNLPEIIGMLSTGQKTGHFQAFQLKTTISLSKSNENINDNNDIYGLSSNEINIEEEKEELK